MWSCRPDHDDLREVLPLHWMRTRRLCSGQSASYSAPIPNSKQFSIFSIFHICYFRRVQMLCSLWVAFTERAFLYDSLPRFSDFLKFLVSVHVLERSISANRIILSTSLKVLSHQCRASLMRPPYEISPSLGFWRKLFRSLAALLITAEIPHVQMKR